MGLFLSRICLWGYRTIWTQRVSALDLTDGGRGLLYTNLTKFGIFFSINCISSKKQKQMHFNNAKKRHVKHRSAEIKNTFPGILMYGFWLTC